MNTIYPGLVDNSIEFFRSKNKIFFLKNGRVKNISDLSFSIIEKIKEAMHSDESVMKALTEWHPSSGMSRIEQFIECRFSGLDFIPDIKEGVLQDGEFWPCPKRGSCPYEGILCKLPVINGHRLEQIEIELIQHSTTDKKNEVIAALLNLPLGTFHALKNVIHKKLGVQTKQELTKIAAFWNLIWSQN